MSATNAILSGILILAASMWIGGLFAIAIVARVTNRVLEPTARVAFFRALGRAYGIVGTASLVVAYATGATLLRNTGWDPATIAAAVVSAALAVALAAATLQARRMTRLRGQALDQADDMALDTRVRRCAVGARALRGLIGVLSLTLLAIGVLICS